MRCLQPFFLLALTAEALNITSFSDPQLAWLVEPPAYKITNNTLAMDTDGGFDQTTDAWMRTYYPWAGDDHHFNMSALVAPVPHDLTDVALEVEFTIKPVSQYDQAGAFIVVDENTWVKAGIEFFAGAPHLSAVVTNDGFSDWSTQPWAFDDASGAGDDDAPPQVTLRLRVTKTVPSAKQGAAVYIEQAAPGDSDGPWTAVRVLPVRDHGKPWSIGVMTAAPTADSDLSVKGSVVFTSLRLNQDTEPCAQC